MKFNEDSRVKIPAILHLARLGYASQKKLEVFLNPLVKDMATRELAIEVLKNKDWGQMTTA